MLTSADVCCCTQAILKIAAASTKGPVGAAGLVAGILYIYMYIYICIYICMYIYTYIHTYIHIYLYIYTGICSCIRVWVILYVFIPRVSGNSKMGRGT